MPRVRFSDQGVEVEVPVGASILNAAQQSGAPEGSACGGVCACSTCHVYVDQGADLLSEASEDEEDILDKAFDVRMNSRLGCQAKLEGDGLVVVRISKESLDAYYNEHPAEVRPAAQK
ncbi:MAG TPA: 2Fe-2S iron-sulfur cluster-binding protein [Polyangiaceae bacterium]|nr:2Fe-2S iron-sulfur cluster-binding protein [Polyangiaceae bacterium]